MEDILGALPLAEDIKRALSGNDDNHPRRVIDLVRAHERGDWERLVTSAEALGVNLEALPSLYLEVIQGAEQGISQAGREKGRESPSV